VSADIPTGIQVHYVDELDAHAIPTGARGIGELGATGVAAAVANAVYDAVRIRIRDLPITPAGCCRLNGRQYSAATLDEVKPPRPSAGSRHFVIHCA
jgi:hypothetical protein